MSEPHGYTIFCDDIREEVGNKVSYMGRYIAELVATARPDGDPLLAKICAAVHVVVPREFPFARCRLTLLEEGGDESRILAELAVERPTGIGGDPQPDSLFIAGNFVLAPFAVRNGAFLRARAYLDDFEVKAGSLHLTVAQQAR